MYESFFDLKVKPFELLPDPKFIYFSKSHKKALTYLDYGIRERAGFILLTGEVGSGKTTLIRDLLDKHYEKTVLAKIFNTRVTSDQLLAMINDDFGLSTQGKDKITLMRDLNGFLVEQYGCGNQPILIIDEAQNLNADLLEEVRMLSNLETSDSKLLQIILVGQPELRTTLAAPELRQLRQRIGINCHLQALNREETAHYIMHRLEVAGNVAAVEFPSESIDIIYNYSKGIPRLINLICDFLMLSAFAEEMRIISVDMVIEVVGDLDFFEPSCPNSGDELSGNCHSDDQNVSVKQKNNMHSLLLDISRRIESMESDIASPIQAALSDFNDRFTQLQNSVQVYVETTDARVSDLKQKIEEIKMAAAHGDAGEVPSDPATVGFVRRLFGSDSYVKLKLP